MRTERAVLTTLISDPSFCWQHRLYTAYHEVVLPQEGRIRRCGALAPHVPAVLTQVVYSTEKSLRALKKEQRERVEELKRKTGYYSTRNLIEKYDDTVKQKVCSTQREVGFELTRLAFTRRKPALSSLLV